MNRPPGEPEARHARRHQRFQHQQHHQQPETDVADDRQLHDPPPVAQQLRVLEREQPERREREEGSEPLPSVGWTMPIRRTDQPRPAGRDQADDRTHDDREHQLREPEPVCGHVVDLPVAEEDPGDHGGGHRHQQGREHERQGQGSEQNLECEQRAAEWDVVHRTEARASAGRDQQPPLPDGAGAPTQRRDWRMRRRTAAARPHDPSETPIATVMIERTPPGQAREQVEPAGTQPQGLRDLGPAARPSPEHPQRGDDYQRRHHQGRDPPPARRGLHRQ